MELIKFFTLFTIVLVTSMIIGTVEYMRHQEVKTKDNWFRKYLNVMWHIFRDASMIGVLILGYTIYYFGFEWYQGIFFLVVWWVNSDGVFSWWKGLNYFRIATQSGNIYEKFGGLTVKICLLVITLCLTIFT
jgi:hypothetical protein